MRENVSLKNLNSFGIEAKARYFIEINSEDELKRFLLQHKKTALPLLVMGGGSNMLFFKDFDGIVLKNNLNGISVVEENETYVKVRVGAGEVWHNVVMWSVEKNLGGLENLSLIPGTAGAAPIQNIGAYGVEIKNSLVAVEAMAIDSAEKKVFSNQECEFGYRNSVFKNAVKGKYIITAIILELKKQPQFKTEYGAIQSELEKQGMKTLSVKAISDAVIAIRKSKLPDPAMIGNAGSFFKNPEITDKEFEKIKQQHPNIPHYPGGENKI
ncbi:MAG TPA: UDP-N-acetylmuramate dehydrogenase, partial [Bacteroidia bacterium]|nr:UDP-N-acetylmuramate dehydrogenase [Bacteroidia bacterium]